MHDQAAIGKVRAYSSQEAAIHSDRSWWGKRDCRKCGGVIVSGLDLATPTSPHGPGLTGRAASLFAYNTIRPVYPRELEHAILFSCPLPKDLHDAHHTRPATYPVAPAPSHI